MLKKTTYSLMIIALFAISISAQIRICSYNVLNFPGSTGTERIAHFQTVLDQVQPDLLVCQEMLSDAGSQQFFEGVLDTSVFDRADWVNYGTSEYMLYYKQDLFDLVDIYTVLTDLRNWEIYELEYIGSGSRPNLFIATNHLKASQGSTNENRRLLECESFIDWLNLNPLVGNNLILAGDLNFYYSDEPGYQALLTDSLFIDPIDTPGSWHDNAAFASIHTQSTRVTSFGGGATGGLDDRFDFVLTTPQLMDGSDWEYVDGSYTPYGNDGQHFNQAINDPPNLAVPQNVADALHLATDHLPVYMDIDYLESTPIQVTLTPFNPPIQIPAGGGSFDFNIAANNIGTSTEIVDIWTMVTLPNGTEYGPIINVTDFCLAPGANPDRDRSQAVPSGAPAGSYTYDGYVGIYPNDIWDEDHFDFEKLGSMDGNMALNEWTTWGEVFSGSTTHNNKATLSGDFELHGAYPNPFNPKTVLSFELRVSSLVDLKVYDISGRLVTELVNGWRDAGMHEVMFDGSDLVSGIYLAWLKTSSSCATQKIVLLK
ncbi:hypothetical protein CEE37_14100 [candidate division LCP-89 bacterium B3_LCP]|uniref:Uncharacterized protein n=1 Tax=candidate division LCP-89 bacterium B3_LCP TaxID=2012998 RepID=A0A532UQN5_UNCL8|nr:MAG: hypothetical protein CEE37_14100 [candidate division LCP-89 bacterium B3_LCP]